MKYFLSIVLLLIASSGFSQASDKYVCLPCGRDCDNQTYDTHGDCKHCRMALVKASTVRFTNIAAKSICDSVVKFTDAIVIDVRSREEFDGVAEENFGRLRIAINIPLQQLESRLSEIEQYKNKKVIVYCSHSHRSPQAAYLLTQNGFKNVANMSGGMSVLFDEKNNSCIKN